MSISSEITRISGNIADAYTALDAKGATLPASGSQNSANLADTIDTISTGGSGGRDTLFDEVKSIIDNTSFPITVGDATTAGWYIGGTNNIDSSSNVLNITENGGMGTALLGYVFSDDIPKVFRINCRMMKVPSGATVTTISSAQNRTVWEVDLTNATDKYIICNEYEINNGEPSSPEMYITSASNDQWLRFIATKVRYVYVRYLTEGYTSEQPKILSSSYALSAFCNKILCLNTSEVLEDIDISDNLRFQYTKSDNIITNFTDGSGLCSSFFWTRSQKVDKTKLAGFVTNFVDGTDKIDLDITKQMLASSSSYPDIIYSQEEFLPILDCSNFTATSGTWNFGCLPYNNTTYSYPYRTRKVKIILPSSGIDVNFLQIREGMGKDASAALSMDSIRFMAQNAPTVSSKTIALGLGLQAYITEHESSIKSTFESKGWSFRSY